MPQNDEDSRVVADDVPAEAEPAIPEGWQRVIRSPITGRRVVASRPGQCKITSEEVRALLGEGDEFPEMPVRTQVGGVDAMPQNDEDLRVVADEAPAEAESATPEGWQREVRCPITGHWVVAARPGQRRITSEEVRALLGEGDDLE